MSERKRPEGVDWNCQNGRNCFNEKKRLKFSVFKGCFPKPQANFCDVDGLIELDSKFLMMEWKPPGVEVSIGQTVCYRRLTKVAPVIVPIVYGDAEYMDVHSFGYWESGEYHSAKLENLEGLKDWIKHWSGVNR